MDFEWQFFLSSILNNLKEFPETIVFFFYLAYLFFDYIVNKLRNQKKSAYLEEGDVG